MPEAQPLPLPPEFALAAACGRWPPSPARDAAVREAAGEAIDWPRFLRIVAHHRIVPLVHHGLRAAGVVVPDAVDAQLTEAAATAARRALERAAETLRLQRAFDTAGLPIVYVKGATLELLAYGQLGLKEAWDIDLLTAPERVVEARGVLEDLGYQVADARLAPAAKFARLVPLSKEVIFHHSERQSWVELHWRLVDNPALIPAIGPNSPTQDVAIGGQSARTLRDEPLYAYLCAHGALHGWSRLKWLVDLAAFVATRTATDAAGLHEAADRSGGARVSGFALLLCHQVLGLPLPAGLLTRLKQDRGIRTLAANCRAGLIHNAGEPAGGIYAMSALRMRAAHFFLAPGRRYLAHQVRLNLVSEYDRTRFALPRGLGFLYPALRIPLWLWRSSYRVRGRPVP